MYITLDEKMARFDPTLKHVLRQSWLWMPNDIPLVIKQLIEEFTWDKNEALIFASENGYTDMAAELHAEGVTPINKALLVACQTGHLSMAQWACTKCCSVWSHALHIEHALISASTHGHLTIAQWAHEEGATGTIDALEIAHRFKHKQLIRWLCSKI